MDQRKQKIIDKKFQLRTTYSVMGIFFILIGVIVLIIGINFYNDNKKIGKIIEEQKNIINSQDEIISSMLQIMNLKSGDNDELNTKIREKTDNNSVSTKNNMDILKELIQRNNVIFIIVLLFLVSAGFILYPVLIRKTHKISGPIYIISEYMKDIINGEYPDIRPLRKKDELKDFYKLFSQLVSFLKKRDNENI